MALNIKNDETERLAREVAARTGESLTEAVRVALAERLERVAGETASTDDDQLWSAITALRVELGPYRAGITTDDLYDPDTGLPT